MHQQSRDGQREIGFQDRASSRLDGIELDTVEIAFPSHKTFDAFVLGHAERVVQGGSRVVAVFGPLPEFARVGAGEQSTVFLRLVLEDGGPFAEQFARAKWHGHFDLLGAPLLPSTTVEPNNATLVPGFVFEAIASLEHRCEASAVCAMRVREIASGVNLMRLNGLQQVNRDLDIFFAERHLADTACLVERHIHVVQAVARDAAASRSGAGFDAADQSFDLLDRTAVDLARDFVLQEVSDLAFELRRRIGVEIELLIKFFGKVDKAGDIVVEYGDVARGLVGDMHLVALIGESDQRAAHRNDIVVWVRRKNEDALRENIVVRPIAIARLLFARRLTCWPAGEGRLQIAKRFEVDVVSRAVVGEQVLQAFFVVVFFGELEDRLLQTAGEPNHCFANRGVVPRYLAKQPRRARAGKVFGGCFVEDDLRVAMFLQKAGRNDGRNFFFNCLLNDRGLAFAESEQENLFRFEDGAYAHRDGTAGDIFFSEKIARRVATGESIERDEPGAAVAARAGFVETNVPCAPYAQNLDIDAANAVDFFFVLPAAFVDLVFGQGAVRNVDVALFDVDKIEQMLVHKPHVALQLLGRHRVVFVEIESDDVFEGKAILLVHPNKLVVDLCRRATRGEAEDTRLAGVGPLPNQLGNLLGDVDASVAGVRKYLARDPFQQVGAFRREVNVRIFCFHRLELAFQVLWKGTCDCTYDQSRVEGTETAVPAIHQASKAKEIPTFALASRLGAAAELCPRSASTATDIDRLRRLGQINAMSASDPVLAAYKRMFPLFPTVQMEVHP